MKIISLIILSLYILYFCYLLLVESSDKSTKVGALVLIIGTLIPYIYIINRG